MTPLVRKTAAWAWRLLVIFAALVALLWVVKQLELIVVPVALATMLAALLLPVVDFLDRRGAPRGGAVALVLLSGIAVVGGILTFVVSQFIEGAPALVEQVSTSIKGVGGLADERPAPHQSATDRRGSQVGRRGAAEQPGEVDQRGTVDGGHRDRDRHRRAAGVVHADLRAARRPQHLRRIVTKIFPENVRERVRDAGRAGFRSLIGYVRATFLVALVDAVGIGTGLAIMGIPLALPLASLVFLGAFIPLVGAVIAGFLAVVVALIAKGWIFALITLGLIIAVQQLEGHVLQPLVMGRAVSIHPLAVVLAIAARRRAGGHRRRAAGGADGRVPQQRGARAAGRETPRPRRPHRRLETARS